MWGVHQCLYIAVYKSDPHQRKGVLNAWDSCCPWCSHEVGHPIPLVFLCSHQAVKRGWYPTRSVLHAHMELRPHLKTPLFLWRWAQKGRSPFEVDFSLLNQKKTSARGGYEESYYSASFPTFLEWTGTPALLGLSSVFSPTAVSHGMKWAENNQVSPAGEHSDSEGFLVSIWLAIEHGGRIPWFGSSKLLFLHA